MGQKLFKYLNGENQPAMFPRMNEVVSEAREVYRGIKIEMEEDDFVIGYLEGANRTAKAAANIIARTGAVRPSASGFGYVFETPKGDS